MGYFERSTPRELPYRCSVCGWQGTEQPSALTDDAYCPNCGTIMFPLSWASTWGIVLAMITVVIGGMALFFHWR